MDDLENKPHSVKFRIEKTELINVKRRGQLEDLSCSHTAQKYLLEGF